jgi:anthranilate phosphoribosyltransferase
MKNHLQALTQNQSLSQTEAKEALLQIGRGEINQSQIAAFLMGIQQKGIAVEELAGFREAMLELAIPINLEEFDAMDLCGTGGDGKDTFNISTTASFVVAGAGQKVAKHGNHGVSSAVGSSTVLEYLGIEFTNDQDKLKSNLEKAGMCYLHAPLFHPAMKYVGPIRKELGMKTFFNLLGPLLNPAKVKKQLTGVYSMEVFRLYEQYFRTTNNRYGIIFDLAVYDEISLTGDFLFSSQYASADEGELFSPSALGLRTFKSQQLSGGDSIEESAKILTRILKNEGTTAQKSVVLANATMALGVARNISIEEAMSQARESLESGKALKVLIELSK